MFLNLYISFKLKFYFTGFEISEFSYDIPMYLNGNIIICFSRGFYKVSMDIYILCPKPITFFFNKNDKSGLLQLSTKQFRS